MHIMYRCEVKGWILFIPACQITVWGGGGIQETENYFGLVAARANHNSKLLPNQIDSIIHMQS